MELAGLEPATSWVRSRRSCSHGVRTCGDDSQPAQTKRLQIKRADARTRTGDPFITSEVLYQLSYVGGAPPRGRP
jgi:hypothetical protein